MVRWWGWWVVGWERAHEGGSEGGRKAGRNGGRHGGRGEGGEGEREAVTDRLAAPADRLDQSGSD